MDSKSRYTLRTDPVLLEKLGYIRKEQDEKDQRMTRIHLTERGEKILGNMHEILRSTEDTLLKNMSTEEKILCRRLLLQMSDNLFQEKEFRDMPCIGVLNVGEDDILHVYLAGRRFCRSEKAEPHPESDPYVFVIFDCTHHPFPFSLFSFFSFQTDIKCKSPVRGK